MKHIFIIGSRGLPARYGGFETFVDKLVSHQTATSIKYHVACLSDTSHHEHSDYKGADCFTIKPPKLGPARVIAYDMMALQYAFQLVEKEKIASPIFYILGNTIGAFIAPFARKIHKLGGQLFINPDGLEWKRSKWSKPVQTYLKYSEKMMTRHADLVIADNEAIEDYIQQAYPWSKTTFIAYGTDLAPTKLQMDSKSVREFFSRWSIVEKGYYLIIGRFVPENNYATIIREFMNSKTARDLVIVCNHEGATYLQQLKEETKFERDARIKFVGTVYDVDLLKYLRQQTRAYLHGHEVGGTNPSLLEALAHTDESLVLDVDFNRKVALDTVSYWTKEEGNLTRLINQIDAKAEQPELGQLAREHMQAYYTWEKIIQQYEDLFIK